MDEYLIPIQMDMNNYFSCYPVIQKTCITGITDMNLLRYLLRMDRITVDEFITSAQLMNITDYELICEKSSDPEITSDYLKRFRCSVGQCEQKNLTVLGGNEDIMDLSLPAQWHISKEIKIVWMI